MNDRQILQAIARNCKRLMADKGLSQAELARTAKVNAMQISRMIHGQHMPSASRLKRIADALGSTIDEIMS